MTAWADHGQGGNGGPLALVLRAGNAGSNTAADHIEAAGLALAQLPRHLRRRVLVRADCGGGTHEFLTWLTAKPQRLLYSVGMTITERRRRRDREGPRRSVGTRPMTATGRSATGRGSRTSPGCSTWIAGPAGCGSSSARSGRTRAHSCGSPTSTGTGSPPSPPTRRKASSLTWSCVTGSGPGARKDPVRRRTPGRGTCR